MHILLTRSLEDCSELALKFQSLGHKVSHLPLLNLEKMNYDKINFFRFIFLDDNDFNNTCSLSEYLFII